MGFAADLARLCVKAEEKCEEVVRRAALELYAEMIQRSPVGNPDVWQVNKGQAYMRETYNLWVDAHNADVGSGKGRIRKKSAKALRKEFANKAGKGYTGGRFKNNWQVGVGVLNDDTSREPSAQGGGALGAFDAAIRTWKPGQTIWMTNSMPYAKKLEYGHSKQAPGGMVRLAVQNYAQAVAKAAREVK